MPFRALNPNCNKKRPVTSTGRRRVNPFDHSATRLKYNEAIRRTNEEELLLRLVRTRYQDSSVSLAVSNVTTQFETVAGANYLNGTDAGDPTDLFTGSLGVADRPTIVLTPGGANYFEEIGTQLTLEQLEFIAGNFAIGSVLRLFVSNINGLDNASTAEGPAPPCPPEFEEFRYVAELATELQDRRGIHLTRQKKIEDEEYVLRNTSVEGFLALKQAGFEVSQAESGEQLIVKEPTITPILSLRVEPDTLDVCSEFQHMLGLDPKLNSYKFNTVPEQFPGSPMGSEKQGVNITTRSLVQASLLLSQGVEVPDCHIECGLVRTTRNPDGSLFDWNQVLGNLFHVSCCKRKPKNARVAVKFRGYWFFIADCDKDSVETLLLFNTAQKLQGIRTTGRNVDAPVLTISAGR